MEVWDMAAISGKLRFDRLRTANPAEAAQGIAGVPIILRNTATNAEQTAVTDPDGNYAFANVPDGDYLIIEPAFPPISAVKDPPAGATRLDAVTPTTIRAKVAGADLTGQDFLNGPVKYTPIREILDTGVSYSPKNLITAADGGTFGGFPQGTPANTGASPNPYPDIGTQFDYALPNPVGITPAFHQYTVQNVMNDATANVQQTWWRVADHTTGNETGRMMAINGDVPGSTIFEQKVVVKPNTYYLFSSWILNLSKTTALSDPNLGVQVLGQHGEALYKATLGELIPMSPNYPEWKQIGTIINSQGNTALTVRFTSEGPEAYGNDYAIDDIALNEARITAYDPQKSAEKNQVRVGETVRYTVTLANTGAHPLTNVKLRDLLPAGMSFVAKSVFINGKNAPEADPVAGFSAPDIPGTGTLYVTFTAKAETVPATNPTVNSARVSYSFSPVRGGIPEVFERATNNVPVEILPPPPRADISLTKKAYPATAIPGCCLTYELTVSNAGPSTAAGTVLADLPPQELCSIMWSTDGCRWKPWIGALILGSLEAGASRTVMLRGTVRCCAKSCVTNCAEAFSLTADPNYANNRVEVKVPVKAAD